MKNFTCLTLLLFLIPVFVVAQSSGSSEPRFFDYLKLFMENGVSIIVLIIILTILLKNPKIFERITSFGAFGVEIQLEKIKEKVDSANNEILSIKHQLDSLQTDYLSSAKVFNPNSSAKERDKLASDLKKAASSLDNIDFLLTSLNKTEKETNVFAAACAIQVNPHPKFFKPIVDYLDIVVKEKDLNKLTLKTLYRLVMCIENIARTDNSRNDRHISATDRAIAVNTLQNLKLTERAQQDLSKAGTRSIVTRIDRTIKVLEKT